jgi:hypothetical protein
MCQGLSGDTVERDKDRQLLARRSNRRAVVMYRSVGPTDQDLVCLLGLRCQDQNVVSIKLDLLRLPDCGQALGQIFIRCTQPQTALPQR